MDNLANKQSLFEIEQEILSSLILKKGAAIPRALKLLDEDDFSNVLWGNVFKFIAQNYKDGVVVSLQTIYNHFINEYELDETTKRNLLDLADKAFTDAYLEQHAEIVKRHSTRRKLRKLAERLSENVNDPKIENDEILKLLEGVSTDLSPQPVDEGQTLFEYLISGFDADVNRYQRYKTRRTGFINLDEVQAFCPGLYVLGGTPGAGKTTFALQLLCHLAQQGERCLFFSYEMSKFELASKVFARIYKQVENPQSELSALDVRLNAAALNPKLATMLTAFEMEPNELTQNLRLFECDNYSVDEIIKCAEPFCDKSRNLTVCVDYLQLVKPTNETKFDKAAIDEVIRKLKVFQRKTESTVIVISSLNRQSYKEEFTLSSFKESGGIEYSADYALALALNVAPDTDAQSFLKISGDPIRPIKLKIVKNRTGTPFECFFNYHAKFDLFVPVRNPDEVPDDDDDGYFGG
jgi:replicative DNA helicase